MAAVCTLGGAMIGAVVGAGIGGVVRCEIVEFAVDGTENGVGCQLLTATAGCLGGALIGSAVDIALDNERSKGTSSDVH